MQAKVKEALTDPLAGVVNSGVNSLLNDRNYRNDRVKFYTRTE